MPDEAAATPFTVLEAAAPANERQLNDLYAYPEDLPSCWVRANFVTSLDGAATTDGRSGGLVGPGDRAIFHLLRELCDVVVVGAGTARTEGYSGATLGIEQRQRRQARGQSEVPPIAVVTLSGRLDRDLKLFTRTEVAPLVLTSRAAAPDISARLAGLAEVMDCSADDPDDVNTAAMLEALADRGLRRVLTEGGPSLLGTFIDADRLDELCLTIAPSVVGGQAGRIATGGREALTGMARSHLLSDDEGYLYARYVRGS